MDFIVEAIKYLYKKYQINFISFLDDEFMAKKDRVIEFCEKRNRDFANIRWSCTGRVNIVEEDIIKLMKESGCVAVQYGFESGSPEILETIKKGASLAQMRRAVNIGRNNGLLIPVSFILGMPGETNKTCQDTVDFCIENNLSLNSLMFATPYPGTKLFDFVLDTGRLAKDKIHSYVMKLEDARDFTINLTDSFTDDELISKRTEMMNEVANQIKRPQGVELDRKLELLFGESYQFFKCESEKDREHRSKHGGLDCF